MAHDVGDAGEGKGVESVVFPGMKCKGDVWDAKSPRTSVSGLDEM